MAKVIGAENQRMLQYNLRREDERKRDKDARTARQRANLARSLTEMSGDPDIDDPNLAKLGMAIQADPTGPVGGIAQAFGAFAAMKGMDKKANANRAKRVDEVVLNLDKIEGFDGGMDMLSEMDPSGEKRSDPRFLQGIANRLQEKQDQERRDTSYAMGLANDTARATEMGLRIDAARMEMEARRQKQLQWEQSKSVVGDYLKDLGMPESQIEVATMSPEASTKLFNEAMFSNLDKLKREKVWDSNPTLQGKITKQHFVDLNEVPEPMALDILNRSAATPIVPAVQKLNADLSGMRNELTAAQEQISAQIPDQLYPVVDQVGNPTEESKAWLVSQAKALGYDYDEDDPLEEQYQEVLTQDVKANGVEVVATRMQQRQQQMISQDPDSAERMQTAMSTNPTILGILNNINSTRTNIADLRKKYPGLPTTTMPLVVHDEETATYPPGVVFRKPNGGFYVTLTNNSMPQPFDIGFTKSYETELPPDGNAQQLGARTGVDSLDGTSALNVDLLKERNIPFNATPLQYTDRAKNAGYRELSEEEIQNLLPSLQGVMPVPLMNTPSQDNLEKGLYNVTATEQVVPAEGSVSTSEAQEITEEEIQAVLAKPSFARRLSPERRRKLAIEFIKDQKGATRARTRRSG